jgi:hypothetical protein
MKTLRIFGAAAATLAVMLLVAQPAAAAPAQSTAPTRSATTSTLRAEGGGGARAAGTMVSCRVTTRWTCETGPLNTFSSTIFHVGTAGIPGDSFVIVRDVTIANWPEVLREYRYYGAEHNHWRDHVYSTYRAELHCPSGCQGAVLAFADY